jgi:L-asparagine oxygenase
MHPSNAFCNTAQELSHSLPYQIKNKLGDFLRDGSPTGFLLFKDIHTGDVPITPPNNKYSVGETTGLARIQAILISAIGYMVAYEAEGYGRLFQDVVPDKKMANRQTSIGSNAELEIHTEQAFSKLRPDFLSLACIRGDPAAMTYILPVQTILDHLTADEIATLKKPLWYTGVDLSFKLNGNEFLEGDVRGPMPILSMDKNRRTCLTFDQDLMRGINDTADEMIRKIVDIYYKYRIAHNLRPGEIIIIDNRYAVHGRSPFFPHYDGADRFLVRCFATIDYEGSQYARMGGGRTIAAIYS